MLYAVLKLLHLGAAVVWLGGMVFTLFCLRPAAGRLDPPVRLPFMAEVLGRFFAVVAVAATLALLSGAGMVAKAAQSNRYAGTPFNMPLDWMVMSGLGVLMVAVFLFIRMVLYRRLRRAVAMQDWPAGGAAVNEIRFWVQANLAFGTIAVAVVLLAAA